MSRRDSRRLPKRRRHEAPIRNPDEIPAVYLSCQFAARAAPQLGGSGCLAKPSVAQGEPGTLQLRFDPNPFDVAFEANVVSGQIMFDLEHPADLHEQFVVREPVAHLVGRGTMRIGTQNPPQPSEVSRQLLERDTLLVAQFTYGAPMRVR